MKWEEKLAELKTLLNEGKTEEIIKRTEFLRGNDVAHLSHKSKAEACAFLGMAYYRRKDFGNAGFWFTVALGSDLANERALYGMAYLAAYVDKDPAKTHEWMAKLPESAARDNAKIIMMRSPEYLDANGFLETFFEVDAIIVKWLKPNPSDPLNVANILHNTGRFYIVYGDTFSEAEDTYYCLQLYSCAVGTLSSAIGLYGTSNVNLHHRAAANYWISVAMEKLFGPAAAIPPACESLKLWHEQLQLDPDNPHYKKSYIDTEEHLLRLLTEIRTLAEINPENMYLKDLLNQARKVLDNEKSREERDIISP